MSQSKTFSALESVTNQVTGFVLALITWQIVGPWFGYVVTLHDNLAITTIFTLVSLGRGYVVRRIFNKLGDR